ncbi:hypothetical protein [Allosphingosinicella deserti]|uniref:Uncharacterized protein n=1 Tax=Allosphingosinicella deserti TaxID=2116704 RepID=A0A2P7QLV3_9SPHN|nr:hypothetical protein [Sphingomonas deserti]PSJ38952.1 hypothetical protein C7I55_16700 [Sphingomonas deserti]
MIILAALLAAPPALPWLDRAALDAQAKIEAVRPTRKPAALGAASARKTLSSDYDAISTLCRAGSKSRDPAAFFAAITDAFAMSKAEAAALRSHCTLYLMGSRDGAQRRF